MTKEYSFHRTDLKVLYGVLLKKFVVSFADIKVQTLVLLGIDKISPSEYSYTELSIFLNYLLKGR